MKKLILTLMLAGATGLSLSASTAPELKVMSWPGFQPKMPMSTVSAATADNAVRAMQMQPTAGVDLPGIDGVMSTELQKAPVADGTSVRRADSRAAAWGEWYDFTSGTISVTHCFTRLFGIPEESRITLQRRDDANDTENSQLRFKGLYGSYDVVMNWNPRTFAYSQEEYTFEGIDNPYSSAVPKLLTTSGLFFPRSVFGPRMFFIVHEGNFGYYSQFVYTPDNVADYGLQGFAVDDNPNATIKIVNLASAGADVARIKYATIYSESPSFKVGERYMHLASAIHTGAPGLEVKTMATSELPKALTAHVTKSGMWCMVVVAYDAADEALGWSYVTFYAGLQEQDKWQKIGVATYTDNYLASIFDTYRQSKPDGALPEWASNLTWEVELQQSKENAGLYRLVNPYTCTTSPCRDFSLEEYQSMDQSMEVTFEKTHDYYLIFDVSNPEAPWAYCTPTGFKVNGNESRYTGSQGVVTGNQTLAPADYYAGQISYDPKGCISSKNEPQMSVLFPGYADYRLRLSFDGYKTVSISHLGSAAAGVRYTVREGGYDEAILEEMYGVLAANSSSDYKIATTDKSGALDLTAYGLDFEKEYTVFACTVDAGGNVQQKEALAFYLQKHDYKFFAQCEFKDPFLQFTTDFYPVDVYTADDAPGHYFVRNPYGYHGLPYDYPSYLDLDCTDPNRVKLPVYDTKLVYSEGVTVYLTSLGFLKEYHGITAVDTDYGKVENNEIVLPAGSLFWQLVPYDASGYAMANDLRLRLPGYVSYEYAVERADSKWMVTEIASAVDEIVYTLVEKDTKTADELFAAIADGSIETASVSAEGELPLYMFNPEPMKYYTLATASVSTDGEGKKVFHEFKSFTFFYDLPVEYLGKGKYQDALVYMFTELFSFDITDMESMLAEREVDLYTSYVLPGTILVKDPLSMIREANYCSYISSSYLPIVIENPDRGYIKDGVFGSLDILERYADYRYATISELFIANGHKPEDIPAEYYGTLRGTVIEIPAKNLTWGNHYVIGAGENGPYQALRLVLPDDYAGVEGVEADSTDAPAEYFDLSGRRVEHPTAGIYIVRRGSKVSKEMVR